MRLTYCSGHIFKEFVLIFFQFIMVALVISATAVLFVGAGAAFFNKIVPSNPRHHILFKIGTGYMLGMSLFLASYRLLSTAFSNAFISLLITLALLLILCLSELKRLSRQTLRKLNDVKFILLGLCTFIPLFEVLYWSAPVDLQYGAMAGSLHTGMYAHIANFIYVNNFIPVLGKSYCQAIMATIPLFFGLNSPFLAINLWLSTTLIALIVSVYGFFLYLKPEKFTAAFSSAVVMCGNTALTLSVCTVLCYGTPIMRFGYIDSLYYMGTFLLFIHWLQHFYSNEHIHKPFVYSVYILALGVSWCLSGAETFVPALALTGAIFFYELLTKKRNAPRLKRMLGLNILLLLSMVIGSTQGGFLAPKSLRDPIKHSQQTGQFSVDFYPLLPHNFGAIAHNGQRVNVAEDNPLPGEEYRSLEIIGGESFSAAVLGIAEKIWSLDRRSFLKVVSEVYKNAWKFENQVWLSLRVAFFPIFGLSLLGLWFRKKRSMSDQYDLQFQFWAASTVVFLAGWCIAFLLRIDHNKWDTTRFLTIGYFLGMINLAMAADIIFTKILRLNRPKVKRGWILLVALTTSSLALDSLINITYNLDGLLERFARMITTRGDIF